MTHSRFIWNCLQQFAPLSGIIGPPEALKSPHYTITGHVDETGHYTLTLRLPGQDHQEYVTGQFSLPDRHTPQCGPFSIELRVWDRDALGGLAHERGATIADVRRDLDAAAGINIYRDGFRVLPYGEPRNDWLRLDLRRVQNPTMRLSNNQIMGYVLISADKNPQLRDQSNREGLIEGPALDDLRELVKMVLAELEERRYTIRRQSDTGQQAAPAGGLFTDLDLTDISDLIRKQYPDDARLLDLVEERERELEMRVKVVQEVLARYRRLATLGQLIDTVLHDGRAPLAKIGNEAHLGQRDIERTRTGNDNLLSRLRQRFGTINTQAGVLTAIFRKIEPFGGRKRGRPAQVRLEQVIADAFAVLETEIAAVGAQVSLPDTDTQVTVDQAEIQEVIVNLLQNSLYWLRQVPQEHRKVACHLCTGVWQTHLRLNGCNLRFQDGEGISNDLFQAHLCRPSTFATTKRLNLTKDGSEYPRLFVDDAKTLTQSREKVAVVSLGTLNIALPQMGFIANFGQRCPAIVEHRVNELPECGQTPIARQDILDHFDTHLKFSFPLLHQIQQPDIVGMLLPDQVTMAVRSRPVNSPPAGAVCWPVSDWRRMA